MSTPRRSYSPFLEDELEIHPKTLVEIAMVLFFNSFDKQRPFSVKFARFRNFFDFAQIWGILESDKL